MRRLSGLDRLVQGFQHNWETNPQFRALWSGVLGLTIIVVMCACMGFAFTFAGSAAARLSGSNNDTSAYQPPANGTVKAGSADSNLTFPTPTIPDWATPQIPASQPIPPSQTPAPTPTALPTATPVPTSPPGGGGGGGGGGSTGVVTISATNPSPLKAGAPATVTIHTNQPNVSFIVNITWQTGAFDPMTNGGGGYSTNGNGDYSLNVTLPPGGCTNGGNNKVQFWVIAQFPDGTVQPRIGETCAP